MGEKVRNLKRLLKFDWTSLLVVIIFLILASYLLPCFLDNIKPDGFSYFSITQKYLDHDFKNALNGYWGPLYSWLLLPFILAGINAPMAAKLLSVLIGFVVILESNFLIKILKIDQRLRVISLSLIAVNILYFTFIVVTPDLLFVCLSLGYLNIILTPSYSSSRIGGFACGIMGAFLYLTKAYGLPFFAVHFFVINLILFISSKNKLHRAGISFNYITGMIIFLLISVPWILLISHKYGYFTIGTAGRFNHSLVGPSAINFPMHSAGLLAPPNSSAISVWEDISNVYMPSWSTLNSTSNFIHQIVIIRNNIARTITIFSQNSIFSLFILAGSAFYLIKKGRQFLHDKIFLILVTMLILISGYLLILVKYRYLWLCNILLIISGFKLLEIIFQRKTFKKITKVLIITIFVFSFLIHPVSDLRCNTSGSCHIAKINNKISPLEIKGRIASDKNWHESLWLAYFNNWRYYGEKGNLSELKLKSQLEKYKIDYFIIWETKGSNFEFIKKNYYEITHGTIDEFKIYDLNHLIQ